MSKKQSQNVPAATEPTPTEQASSVEASGSPIKAGSPAAEAEQTSSPEPFQLIRPFKIPGKAKGMAKAAGIDLSEVEEMGPKINEWAGSVEKRLDIILAAIPNLPMATIELLRKEAEKQRSEIMQKTPVAAEAPAGKGGFDIGSVLEILKTTGIMGGGGSSGVGDEITKQVIDAGIKQMFAGTRLLETIQNKIMTDMGVKAVTEAVTPK